MLEVVRGGQRTVEEFGSGDLRGLIEMEIWTWMQLGVDGIGVEREHEEVVIRDARQQPAGPQRWM